MFIGIDPSSSRMASGSTVSRSKFKTSHGERSAYDLLLLFRVQPHLRIRCNAIDMQRSSIVRLFRSIWYHWDAFVSVVVAAPFANYPTINE